MKELTFDQKIQIMTLATQTGLEVGKASVAIEEVISNYQKMIKEITSASE